MSTLGGEISSLSHSAFVHESVPFADILHVFGDIDVASVGDFAEAMRRAQGSAGAMLVDLSRCEYLGAAGLSALLQAYRRLGSGFGVVVSSGSIAARLFSLLPSHIPFAVVPSLEAWLRYRTSAVGEV